MGRYIDQKTSISLQRGLEEIFFSHIQSLELIGDQKQQRRQQRGCEAVGQLHGTELFSLKHCWHYIWKYSSTGPDLLKTQADSLWERENMHIIMFLVLSFCIFRFWDQTYQLLQLWL